MKVGKDVTLIEMMKPRILTGKTPKQTKKEEDPKWMIQQLKKISKGSPQSKFYDWILKKGESFKGRTLTKKEEKELEKIFGRKLYKKKHCYYNAQLISLLTQGKYEYYEGYARTEKLPFSFEHSWLIKDGKVFDPTWEDGVKYFGVKVPFKFLKSHIMKSGRADMLLIKYYAKEVA